MEIYFEEHGPRTGRPLVLLPGALSGVATSFGELLPLLAARRHVIAVEFQGHGRTPDIDRPFTIEHFAADVVELLDRLGVERADVLGWSMGASVGLRLGTDHAGRVGRLVLASAGFEPSGAYPGLLEGIQDLRPEHLHGSEFHEEYLRTAPDPGGFARLVEKMKVLDADLPEWTRESVRALAAPVLLVLGDADIVRPEHIVEMFRLVGGGVPGDIEGLPASRLAILPGTTHVGVPSRAAWLAPMVEEFLGAGEDDGTGAQPTRRST
ncbi:oxidoreductase [Actinorhabdospora filicis]|uniref:Oxidoreductase n=1 Tax=Actinorhabdospora filicis TaxID=1785913 RepID=A0A9W6SLA4_9ACTN|nr:alpha/beta hydrolase [Actinorhabdospora filicis]GLZ77799.1 oxidoreductase [Actinorhabdospora filicis]